jgi:CarD family transcriptional regulator
MFQIGDKVVHPIYGAGTIRSIEERQDRDQKSEYYVIPDTIEADRLLVPINAAARVGLRRAVSSADAEELLKIIKSEGQALASTKQERAIFLQKIDWNDPFQVAELWRDLSCEAKSGKLSAVCDKVRKRARRLLLSELCLSMGLSSQECTTMMEASEQKS